MLRPLNAPHAVQCMNAASPIVGVFWAAVDTETLDREIKVLEVFRARIVKNMGVVRRDKGAFTMDIRALGHGLSPVV